jgi:NTE family protein
MSAPWLRLAAVASLLAAACTGSSTVPPDRLPRFEPLAFRPKVALVLGSGGPRGFAHVGVLKVLEEHGVKPDLVVGASVGAMVGVLYAHGYDARTLERMAHEVDLLAFFEWSMVTRQPGTGVPLQKYVNRHLDGTPLERLRTPVVVVATRRSDGEPALFNHGDAGLAVRASSATPEQFKPVEIGSESFVDGDESTPVPIRVARSLGAEVVIAVDVSAHEEDTPPDVPREWVAKDRRRAAVIRAEAPQADVLLHPNIGYYAGHSKEYRSRVMSVAEAYTRERIPAVLAALGKAQKSGMERSPPGVASR